MKEFLINADVRALAVRMNQKISRHFGRSNPNKVIAAPVLNVFAIPRGGIPAAYALLACDPHHYKLVDKANEADLFVDDIIDSGATSERYESEFPLVPFFALMDKQGDDKENKNWIVWPWENAGGNEEGVEANVTRIIQYIGEDAERGGLIETPRRFTKALGEWFSGYKYTEADITKVLKVFEDGAEKYDQMVIVKDIPIYSKCEHHIADIFGTATIAYIPNGKIVGLSKLSRLADIFARRLQVQERLTNQIANAIDENLEPLGVGVIIRARHMCMESRGLCQQGHHTISIALRGALKTDALARAEFMALA